MVDSGRLDAFASDTWQYTADLRLGSPLLLPVRTDKLSEESTDVGSKSEYTLSLRGCVVVMLDAFVKNTRQCSSLRQLFCVAL